MRRERIAISSRIFLSGFSKEEGGDVRLEKAKIERLNLKCKCFHLNFSGYYKSHGLLFTKGVAGREP